jgi:alpha,alpha-trehalase
MPDGALLNRFWDDRDGPRDESWAEDLAIGRKLGRELRAAAESGWDFSSRWLGDGATLATIRTTRLVPCDLNALLYGMERELGLARAAEQRSAAMTCWLWHEDDGRFGDWDIDAGRINPGLTAATTVPLFTGAAVQAQADRVAATISARLLGAGGLRTTSAVTGQQWDAPNGWAPLQWFAIVGLRRYGHTALAGTIAARWIATVEAAWRETGLLFEKYDVEQGGRGDGGEYAPQTGFGWTNGVTSAILKLFG